MMDRELLSVLFLAFLPGIVLVISGAISAVRTYGLTFLWCLRFQPVREKLRSMLYEMHPATTANAPSWARRPRPAWNKRRGSREI